jgi:hypothetical protein
VDPALANQAPELAMEWGEQWLMPTQERLGALYPELSQRELDAYDKLARKLMREAQAAVAEVAQEHDGDGNPVLQARLCAASTGQRRWLR